MKGENMFYSSLLVFRRGFRNAYGYLKQLKVWTGTPLRTINKYKVTSELLRSLKNIKQEQTYLYYSGFIDEIF